MQTLRREDWERMWGRGRGRGRGEGEGRGGEGGTARGSGTGRHKRWILLDLFDDFGNHAAFEKIYVSILQYILIALCKTRLVMQGDDNKTRKGKEKRNKRRGEGVE